MCHPMRQRGCALSSQNKQLFSKPCLLQRPPREIYRSGLWMDLEICHVGSGQQTLIVTLVENCLWFTLCTPCPYFHVCSLTKIWTEEMLDFLKTKDIFSRSSSVGAWWWWSWSQGKQVLPRVQAPDQSQTAWSHRRASEKHRSRLRNYQFELCTCGNISPGKFPKSIGLVDPPADPLRNVQLNFIHLGHVGQVAIDPDSTRLHGLVKENLVLSKSWRSKQDIVAWHQIIRINEDS